MKSSENNPLRCFLCEGLLPQDVSVFEKHLKEQHVIFSNWYFLFMISNLEKEDVEEIVRVLKSFYERNVEKNNKDNALESNVKDSSSEMLDHNTSLDTKTDVMEFFNDIPNIVLSV